MRRRMMRTIVVVVSGERPYNTYFRLYREYQSSWCQFWGNDQWLLILCCTRCTPPTDVNLGKMTVYFVFIGCIRGTLITDVDWGKMTIKKMGQSDMNISGTTARSSSIKSMWFWLPMMKRLSCFLFVIELGNVVCKLVLPWHYRKEDIYAEV